MLLRDHYDVLEEDVVEDDVLDDDVVEDAFFFFFSYACHLP